jgi:hypothetical protein
MPKTLEFEVPAGQLPLFFPLLEKGIMLDVLVDCSIKELLCGQLGLSEAYLDQRVQTLFLNAKAVDDVQTMMVRDHAVLALSAAMPGLVGATLRKGGAYAAFRREISAKKQDPCAECTSGRVTLKLFNMIRNEFGPGLLSRGVWVQTADLQGLLSRIGSQLQKSQAAERFQSQPIAWEDLLHLTSENAQIFLQVHTQPDGSTSAGT